MVDTLALGASAARYKGSSPFSRTNINFFVYRFCLYFFCSMNLKVALVHDFLFQFGGAEKVVEQWLIMYPKADLYTAFYFPEKFEDSPAIKLAESEGRIKTSLIQKLFNIRNSKNQRLFGQFAKHLFWLYPLMMRLVTIKDYFCVLISSTDCAKQVRFKNCYKIIHYIHTPTRYLNGLVPPDNYNHLGLFQRFLLPIFAFLLKPLDLSAVNYLKKQKVITLANSEYIQFQVWDKYTTQSQVLYPPVDTVKFNTIERKPELIQDFYLSHGRISFHKRIDMAIQACLELEKKLVISGGFGLESDRITLQKQIDDFKIANPSKKVDIQILGRTTDAQLRELMTTCKAFLFPGKEDFGIAPIEFLAAGIPLIALAEGGALTYVIDNKNGVFFDRPEVESLKKSIIKFEELNTQGVFDTEYIRQSAQRFSTQAFRDNIKAITKL